MRLHCVYLVFVFYRFVHLFVFDLLILFCWCAIMLLLWTSWLLLVLLLMWLKCFWCSLYCRDYFCDCWGYSRHVIMILCLLLPGIQHESKPFSPSLLQGWNPSHSSRSTQPCWTTRMCCAIHQRKSTTWRMVCFLAIPVFRLRPPGRPSTDWSPVRPRAMSDPIRLLPDALAAAWGRSRNAASSPSANSSTR